MNKDDKEIEKKEEEVTEEKKKINIFKLLIIIGSVILALVILFFVFRSSIIISKKDLTINDENIEYLMQNIMTKRKNGRLMMVNALCMPYHLWIKLLMY